MNSKVKLESLSEEHEKELEKELEALTEKGRQLATNALMIAGGLALSYLVFKSIFSSEPKKKKKKVKRTEAIEGEAIETEASMFGQIGSALAKEATVFLLGIAKEKLVEYLNSRNESAERHPIEEKAQ
ncbi:hypothetical protein [Fulvivirga lutea]|uniref:Uncharacterized protein n=1 Tax=Fulvivirga lutea TaxID=2810512 RepID=A0A975A1R7_9BACT|nr:hypothetical protein [Fulvivirga lutea]QSE98616.1 hypothetical protein JR347_05930 [Fulvivirga lutea]